MVNSGCISCEHKNFTRCQKGFDDACATWWANNGHKYRGVDTFDPMECFQPNQFGEVLEEANSKVEELLKTLKENQNSNS